MTLINLNDGTAPTVLTESEHHIQIIRELTDERDRLRVKLAAVETAQRVLTHIQNRCWKERGHNYDGDGVCLSCWFDQGQNAIQVPK